MPTPLKFHNRCYHDGYDHGLRGAPSGCSYYEIGTSAHSAYMDGWRDGWRARRALWGAAVNTIDAYEARS